MRQCKTRNAFNYDHEYFNSWLRVTTYLTVVVVVVVIVFGLVNNCGLSIWRYGATAAHDLWNYSAYLLICILFKIRDDSCCLFPHPSPIKLKSADKTIKTANAKMPNANCQSVTLVTSWEFWVTILLLLGNGFECKFHFFSDWR